MELDLEEGRNKEMAEDIILGTLHVTVVSAASLRNRGVWNIFRIENRTCGGTRLRCAIAKA